MVPWILLTDSWDELANRNQTRWKHGPEMEADSNVVARVGHSVPVALSRQSPKVGRIAKESLNEHIVAAKQDEKESEGGASQD